jgi:hypothetical protein
VGIYDLRRVFKVAYTLDYKTGNVALPLSDDQFNRFSWDMVLPERIGSVKQRGLLTRTHGCTDDQLHQNTKKMFEELVYG